MAKLPSKLSLSDVQQAKIRPILEQESGELSPLWSNPAVSHKEKLDTLERVVRASDEKMRPILSQNQQERLQELRKEQKDQVKKLTSGKEAGKQN